MPTDERQGCLAQSRRLYDRARELFAEARAATSPSEARALHARGEALERQGAIHWAAAYPSQRRAA